MRKKTAGFTLIELIVTVALAAVVLTLGVPSFQSVIERNLVATQTNQLVSAFTLARSEAVKRGVLVSVCNLDASGCAAADYSSGYLVFTDIDENGDYNPSNANPEEAIQVFDLDDSGLTITGGTAADFITYGPDGFLNVTSGDTATRTITIAKNDLQREISVSVMGRPSIKCSSGGEDTSCY